MQIYTVTFNPRDSNYSAYTMGIFPTRGEAENFIQERISKGKIMGNYWDEYNYEIGIHPLPAETVLACYKEVLKLKI